jgi:hypothetical protein
LLIFLVGRKITNKYANKQALLQFFIKLPYPMAGKMSGDSPLACWVCGSLKTKSPDAHASGLSNCSIKYKTSEPFPLTERRSL